MKKAKSKLSKSQKKFIRLEKARIRGKFSDKEEQKKSIDELYKSFEKKPAGQKPVKEEKAAEKPVKEKTEAGKKESSTKKKKDENKGNIQSGDK